MCESNVGVTIIIIFRAAKHMRDQLVENATVDSVLSSRLKIKLMHFDHLEVCIYSFDLDCVRVG